MQNEFKYSILVVGSGGTGGYFLKEFSRYLSGSQYLQNCQLAVCDGDVVEQHNLTRQCFITEDIGEKKASILAESLNDVFSLAWKCYPQYITSEEQLEKYLDLESDTIPVIIGCVDNHGCRLICENFFKKAKNCFYFDSANEIMSGEVVFAIKARGQQISPLRSEIFPDVLKGDVRNVTELSCEEMNTILPQHICTNMLAGNILLSAMTGLLEKNTCKTGFTSFDVSTMYMEFHEILYHSQRRDS